jgi:serine phosphatase RsbU (regulator of sigma subunit)
LVDKGFTILRLFFYSFHLCLLGFCQNKQDKSEGNQVELQPMTSSNILDKPFFTYGLFLLSFLLITIVGYRTFQASLDLAENSRSVAHINQVVDTSEKLLTLMKDAESGQRGYLLMQQKQYLQPYEQAQAQVSKTYDALRLLTQNNPIQQRRLHDVNRLIKTKMDEIIVAIALNDRQSVDEAVDFVRTGHGERTMDAIRKGIFGFQQEELRLLHSQAQQLEKSRRSTLYLQGFGSGLSILLLGLAFLLLRRKLLREQMLNNELELRVQERTEELHASLEELMIIGKKQTDLIDTLTHIQNELQDQKKKTEKAYNIVSEDNKRKTAELQDAQVLQLSMLPPAPPNFPHLEVSMHMQTASEVGGDYYDYTLDEEGDFTFAIGDVTGHGFKSGILVATAKSYFQLLGANSTGPQILHQISEGIRSMAIRGMYMGLTIIKFKKNRVTITSAGMPPVMIYRQGSQEVEFIQLDGIFLGFNPKQQFKEVVFTLAKGDVLLAMTDGLVEQFNPNREPLEHHNICAHFKQVAHQCTQDVVNELICLRENWAGTAPQNDDMSLLVVKLKH